jgi:hypothetical protein
VRAGKSNNLRLMGSTLERLRTDFDELVVEGTAMFISLMAAGEEPDQEWIEALATMEKSGKAKEFRGSYEGWYSEAEALVAQLLPNRVGQFRDLYRQEKRKEITAETYGIADFLLGISVSKGGVPLFEPRDSVVMKFKQQREILGAVERKFDSSLFDLRQLVQADVLDGELDGARELAKAGFDRAAAVIAGVALERHLRQVATQRSVTTPRSATIARLNDALKDAGVIDTPEWRRIQRLGDLRNLGGHAREREPSAEEVQELIEGVSRVTKLVI